MTIEVSKSTILQQLQDSYDLGPTSSIQVQFAKLQLALAEFSKCSAQDQMDAIEASQTEQSKVSAMLQQARQLQSDAGDKGSTTMPADMVTYMKNNNLAYSTKKGDNVHNKDEWEIAIQSLQAHLEQLGTATQQQMVLINDYMGQYNSYLQGANTSISNSNQTLQKISLG